MIDSGLNENRSSEMQYAEDSMDDARSMVESLQGESRGTTEEEEIFK